MTELFRHQPFVGRRAELAGVEFAVADAGNGVPSVLLVEGDAGIGKSSLVLEALGRAEVPAYLGRCVHLGSDMIPLAPLADLLRQVRRARPEALGGSELAAILGGWLSGSLVSADLERRPGSLFLPVLELIGQLAAHGPIVVGFEDLHWADAATWDLFEFLARHLVEERVVLVGTYRANEVSTSPAHRRRVAELGRLPAVHRVHLVGFDRHEVSERVAALLGGPPPAGLVDEVLARGQGNPFFTEELVAAHLTGETIPPVLSDLISTEVAGLDDSTRRLLGAVAAVGRETDHELLTRIVGLADDAVEAAVRVAIDADLLVVDRSTDAYRFRHALIGEVVYADLLPPQRGRLHRAIAEALEQQAPDTLSRADRAGELAFHLDRAGDLDGAFLALLAAADAAEAVAPAAALRHLERAFELWDAVEVVAGEARRGDRLWQAAELAGGTVGNDRAIELARAAFAVSVPPLGAAWGHERLGRYLWAGGHLEASRVEFELAASLLPDPPGVEAAAVIAGLAQAELMSGRSDSAERWCLKVFELVPTSTLEPRAWVMARRVLGLARSQLGDPEEAVALCREAVAAAPDALTRALAAIYLGAAMVDAGRSREVVNVMLDAVAEVQLAGLDRSFGAYLDALAAVGLTRLGRWSEAETVLVRHAALETLPVGALRVACAGAKLAARRGEGDRARVLLAAARAQPCDGMHLTFLDWVTADVHLILGGWNEAAVAAERGWGSNPVSTLLWSARFAMLSVEAAVEQALDALARRAPMDRRATIGQLQRRVDAVRAVADVRAPSSPALDTAAHLAHAAASITRLSGPDPDAWAAATEGWRLLGDRWAAAVAQLHEAEAAAATDAMARAAAALHDAHRVASELGAAPLLAQVHAVSRRTRLSLDSPARLELDEASVHRLGLTPREAEVLTLVSAGMTNRQIGAQLFVSEKTASVHVSNILRKLGVSSRVDAAAVAQRLGVA